MANVARSLISASALWRRRYLCTSTSAASAAGLKRSSTEKECSWFRRLRGIDVNNKGTKLERTIDGWIADGADIKKFLVSGWIQRFRRIKMNRHALQVSEWMKKNKDINNQDRAMHIDLLSKTKGISEAEKYFDGLKMPEKTVNTFGALLSCYCHKELPGKAMDLIEKMKDFGITPSTWNMNHLLFLHLKVGQPEKVPLLFQMMNDFGFGLDLYTYIHLMNSYAALKDYDGVAKVFEKLLASDVKANWCTYGTLAKIYINAGYIDKATEALENIERMKSFDDPEAFSTLISLYGETNNFSGVYRVWETGKSLPNNIIKDCYLSLLTTLAKLGDVDVLDKYFNEWKSSSPKQDMRVYDVMLKSYLHWDMLPRAESLSKELVTKKVNPTFITLSLYMDFHLKKGQTDIALKYLEQGAAKMKEKRYNDWFPDEKTVALFRKSFEGKQDVNSQKFNKIMNVFAHRKPGKQVYKSFKVKIIS